MTAVRESNPTALQPRGVGMWGRDRRATSASRGRGAVGGVALAAEAPAAIPSTGREVGRVVRVGALSGTPTALQPDRPLPRVLGVAIRDPRAVGSVELALPDEVIEELAERVAERVLARLDTAEDRWLDSHAAAEYLGLPSVNALHKLTASRELPFSQDAPRGRCYFQKSALDAWRKDGE